MSSLAAIVLAAGVSSRMGRFKPMLEVDGQTMIHRVVETMLKSGAHPVVVVTGYKRQRLENHLAGMGVCFVHNGRYFQSQMLDSLVLGLSALPRETERVLVCPADIPLVEEDTVRALLCAQGAFTRPIYQGTPGHPVVIARELFSFLRGYDGPNGLRGALEAWGGGITDVPVDDQGTTLDGDTKDEYAALLQYRRRQTGRPQRLQLDLRICLQAETAFWGPGCAQFLELIQTTGSIFSACQCMHMAYSKGWKMVNEIENQLGFPVLVRSQGGNHGGGSELTEGGRLLLASYQRMEEEIRTQSQVIFQRYFPQGLFPPDGEGAAQGGEEILTFGGSVNA